MWLDWCQIRSLSGDSFGGNSCCGNCGVLGERVGAVVSAEVNDITLRWELETG